MAKVINGSDLMLFMDIDGAMTAVAYATNHTLTWQANTEDISSKDSGKWEDHETTTMGWVVVSENLVGGVGTDDPLSLLLGLGISGEALDVHMTLASNADTSAVVPEGGWTPDLAKGWKGKAIVDNVVLNGPDKKKASMTINLKGKGELKKSTGV